MITLKTFGLFRTGAIALMLLLSGEIWGQATNATFRGVIKDMETGELLPGANLVLKNTSTGFSVGTVTNINGEYLFNQVPLGGPYTLSVSYIGYGEIQKSGFMINLGNTITEDFKLDKTARELEELMVSAAELKRQENLGAVTSISSQQIKNLPTEGRNFTRLVSLSPLQGGGSINLGGQRRTSTNVTIDGANARNTLTAGEIGRGPYTISQEAIREFEVSTNNYDVTQGRQGGGAINAVTKSGTNEWTGSVFTYFRNDALQSKYDIDGDEREADFSNLQTGFSIGGPLIKDKLHFYTVYERQDATDPRTIAFIQNEDDENRLGVTQENLDRFQQIARDRYGLSNSRQIGQFERETTANTWFFRLDYQINDNHTLTFRNNFNKWDAPFNTSDNSNIELREVWSDFSSQENSSLLSLRSTFSPSFTNELKIQYQRAERSFLPNPELPSENIPRAIVFVRSELPNDNSRNRSVQIGGQRFTPETNQENQIHFSNTSYLSKGKFNITVGTDNMITFLETLLSNEQNGRFFFNTLEDFENMTPSRYAREVPLQGLPIVEQTVIDLSFFGQVNFSPLPHVDVTAGLRYDATAFLDAAEFNPTVFNELGINTNVKPADWDNVQPRFQINWDVGGRGTDLIKLGGGAFTSQPHYYAQVNNIQNSGTLLGAIDISGDDVPFPDFVAYRNDPSTVPGVDLVDQLGLTPFSTINAVREDFEVPTIWKANLSYTHFVGDRYSIGINGLISRTRNNYVYQESNLVEEPFFNEPVTGRPIFAPASTIDEDGLTDWLDSRISPNVGRALVLESTGRLNQWAVIFEGSARIGEDGYINASYTINQAKDNSSYNCCVANTSTFLPVEGDPRDLNFGFSDNHFDNKLVVNAASPTFYGFTLGATLTGSGGTRFSFHVDDNTSINGDFNLRNDIAYIFDPNDPATPEGISQGYQQILDDPEVHENYKEYLRESFGGYAERNGGRNPFAATIDLRLAKRFRIPNSKHALEFTADLFNFANLLNKEWGRTENYNRRNDLMRVTGFDQATRRFDYNVQTGSGTTPINGTPWRLQLGVRYSFGE